MSSCAVPYYPVRVLKAKGEQFHKMGNKVWLVKDLRSPGRVTVNLRPGRPFGRVEEDSMFPDLWVTITVWNKDQWIEYENRLDTFDRWAGMGFKKARLEWRSR